MANMAELQYDVELPSILDFAEDLEAWMKANDGRRCRSLETSGRCD